MAELKGGGGGVGAMPPPLNTLLTALHPFRDMIIIRKESTIVFSAIDNYFKKKKRFYASTI